MSGWRAKIGVISVVSDSFEEYIHGRSPEGVSFISTKIPVRYTSKDIATAFRAYADYNIDRILFTGKESKEELEDILKSEEIDIASDTIITKNEILGSVFASESNREKILIITPYEEQDDSSDAEQILKNSELVRRNIPLSGVVNEGLRLDDATDYWKYHRVADVLSSVQNEVFDALYIEDIELGITGMIGQLREAYGRQILCTQEILLDETLKACGIGSGREGIMQSYRARIALITGSGNSVSNSFNKWAPPGVDYAATRVEIEGAAPDSLIRMSEQVADEAKKFYGKHYDLVIYSCTSGSCIRGESYNQSLISDIEKGSGSRGLTTSRAVMEAFEALGCTKTAVLTPYPDDTNELEKLFLQSLGVDVVSIKGVGFHQSHEDYTYADPRFIYRNVKTLDMEGADSIFISCMALDTFDLIEVIEQDFGLPVITSRQATFWASLRHCNVRDRIPGLGRLLTL